MPDILTKTPEVGLINLFVDGVGIAVEKGLSVAAAIEASGSHGFSRGLKGEPRGLFCGMGACQDCLVAVDGRLSQRACMTIVADGMRIERPSPRAEISSSGIADLCDVPSSLPTRVMDMLVVGAGPAGLAAAQAAVAAGASVTIVDERATPGGQYFKQPSSDHAKEHLRGDAQASQGADLIRLLEKSGVAILRGTMVWGAQLNEDGKATIGCFGPDGAFYCQPKFLIIATGAYERPAAVPGWTLPGAMTAGAAQTLLRSYATVPGKRIVVTGNGPLNIQVANEIRKAGGIVVALADKAAPPWKSPGAGAQLFAADATLALLGCRQLSALRSAGTKVFWETTLKAIHGREKVESVTISGPKGERTIDADAVLIGGDFTPSNELSRLLGCGHEVVGGELSAICGEGGETTIEGIHVIGEAARFGGAYVAMAEGRLAGLAVAKKLGLDASPDIKAQRRLGRHRAFQKALWNLFAPIENAVQIQPPETIVCRCEGVTLGTLQAISARSANDVATVKRLSRAGMGRCQGRYCSKRVANVVGETRRGSETQGFLAPQMPLRPLPLAALAVEKPEWGGHKRAMLPERSPRVEIVPLPISSISTLVIGAGIAGLSTALFLARAGEDVAIVERAFPNSLASGGNAGSLHAQLLSFDHGSRAEAGGGPAVQTLPLQRDSIRLWADLQKELGRDFEMKVTGGVMVAETDAHMRFLAAKVAAERGAGIDSRLIDRDELRHIEPHLSPDFVGAAYCSQEGKINPLVATQYVLEAAQQQGAHVFERCEVLSIASVASGGFDVRTSRGNIRVKRVINAAGAFASRIGAMLGLDIPVFGAPLQMVVTEAAAPLITCLVAHADRHLTLKQAFNGNFIIGGGWTAGLDPVHQHPRPSFSSLEGNLWVAQHVVPALRKLNVIRSWAAMNINIDGAPILGEHPSQPGFFNAVTSNGYTLGPLIGHLTAQLVLGRETGQALQPFSISRFSKGRS
ncbi:MULTISPECIES: FAD-dependent oxidoreductase [Rhizobium]|uniref:FAD-dependent oxidoreductase n=1 Tax=Rhizobium rhododendri TaxID=2506430 RepID=A0ABY8IRU1_9HYPH|nr:MULTISPECIES: FAD-dependent oxidoreductase [Rhizobium]TQX85214.1 FAD-dependent oxidoreductase [Rhizobium sp. rho-13.1]TQY09502.1 FAD-dependent oxidoreductase [Rhizobium sp. rho-1.1]WFS26036.1 FAD-dependent oxidoreductase [Rhizobium rhododendri]